MSTELIIRLAAFIGVFVIIAFWETKHPCRPLILDKMNRWLNNLGLVILNTIILRLIFPTAAVGVAALASEHNWGLLNQYPLDFGTSLLISIIVLDLIIYFQHVLFHAVPLLWRLHMVHHSTIKIETNSNYGFNLSCWDRIFGTYRAQPTYGQKGMTIGLNQFREPKIQNLFWLLLIPFTCKIGEYPINRDNQS